MSASKTHCRSVLCCPLHSKGVSEGFFDMCCDGMQESPVRCPTIRSAKMRSIWTVRLRASSASARASGALCCNVFSCNVL